jgi:hypothetical protein
MPEASKTVAVGRAAHPRLNEHFLGPRPPAGVAETHECLRPPLGVERRIRGSIPYRGCAARPTATIFDRFAVRKSLGEIECSGRVPVRTSRRRIVLALPIGLYNSTTRRKQCRYLWAELVARMQSRVRRQHSNHRPPEPKPKRRHYSRSYSSSLFSGSLRLPLLMNPKRF